MPESGRTTEPRPDRPQSGRCAFSRVNAAVFSSIRTITVGSGITPDLLTLLPSKGARGLPRCRDHRRWGLAPRPENMAQYPPWARPCQYAASPRDGKRRKKSGPHKARRFGYPLFQRAARSPFTKAQVQWRPTCIAPLCRVRGSRTQALCGRSWRMWTEPAPILGWLPASNPSPWPCRPS